MKKTIINLVAIICMSGTMLTGCQSSADRVQNAQDKLQDANEKVEAANQELDQAMRDSIQQFRKESEETIMANEKIIAEYKIKIAREKVGNRARNERRLAELEQQNSEMKRDLEDFNEVQRDKWDSFRIRFNHNMDKHAREMRDFWTKGK
ncbi:MAG: hypothetical protein Q8M08_07600 [Bacteroidales bacterium]|nr:hypothetical protein [Bacteroidales bacterium]